MSIFAKLKTDPQQTVLKGKSHRFSQEGGLLEISFTLSSSQRSAFEQRSKELRDALKRAVDGATAVRDEDIAKAKQAANNAIYNAQLDYDRSIHALFVEFSKLPTVEQIATAETEPGHVVRLPQVAQDSGVVNSVAQAG